MIGFHTLESGSGIPLVFLHGVLGDNQNWQTIFPYLPPSAKAIAPRFPFFDSPAAGMDSVGAATDFTQAFLEQAGYSRFVIGGNSLGGHVAMHLALRMPQRVMGLVLTGSSGLFERSFGSIAGIHHPPREWIREITKEVFYDPIHVTETLIDSLMQVIETRCYMRKLIKIVISAKRDFVGDRINEITCPTLLIWGKQDAITRPEVAEDFRKLIPDSELCWIDKCGHTPMMEHPEVFGKLLCDWWQRRITPQPAYSG
jgi:pimeloyl-ACP methyl ester carboxylesterase